MSSTHLWKTRWKFFQRTEKPKLSFQVETGKNNSSVFTNQKKKKSERCFLFTFSSSTPCLSPLIIRTKQISFASCICSPVLLASIYQTRLAKTQHFRMGNTGRDKTALSLQMQLRPSTPKKKKRKKKKKRENDASIVPINMRGNAID